MELLPPVTDTNRARESWLLIFADVLALLLTFFVLMFAMNSVRVEGWQAVVSTFTARLNPSRPETVREIEGEPEAAEIRLPTAMDLDYLNNIIEIKVKDHPILGEAIIRRYKGRLVFSVPTDLLFEAGSAELAPSGLDVAAELGELFRSLSNRISVGGHAELLPGSDGEFANHWDLSLARAVTIAHAIRNGGYLRRVPAFGRGNALFDLTAKPESGYDASRFARRIDVVIEHHRNAGGFDGG